MRLIEGDAAKPAVPAIAAPAFPEVDRPRIALRRFATTSGQSVLTIRPDNQLDVVGHQAVRPNLQAPARALLLQQVQIGPVLFRAEEHRLPAIAALGDMLGQVGHRNTRQPRHAASLLMR